VFGWAAQIKSALEVSIDSVNNRNKRLKNCHSTGELALKAKHRTTHPIGIRPMAGAFHLPLI
jgi:hypothetical protein